MKRTIIVLITLYCCLYSYSQNNLSPKITGSDFIKGMDDKDYLRAELIEDGFNLYYDTVIDSVRYEIWGKKKSGLNYYTYQATIVAYLRESSRNGSEIRVILRSELFPSQYTDSLIDDINKAFPIRRIHKIANDEEGLYYSRDSDKKHVELWIIKYTSQTWTFITFVNPYN